MCLGIYVVSNYTYTYYVYVYVEMNYTLKLSINGYNDFYPFSVSVRNVVVMVVGFGI